MYMHREISTYASSERNIMPLLLKIFKRWIPLAVVIVLLCGLVYGVSQQTLRQTANDPQLQMAYDAAQRLALVAWAGAVVPEENLDIATTLSTFVIVFDSTGTALSSSGRLHGEVPVPPAGVFDYVRAHGEDRITWQPEKGVRIAAVIVPAEGLVEGLNNGYVLVGKSLRETERRIRQVQLLTVAGLVFILVVSLGMVALVETVTAKKKKHES